MSRLRVRSQAVAGALPASPLLSRGAMVWSALAIVYVAWGSTYVAIRVMDRTVAPLIGASVRFLLAGVLMYACLALARGRAPRVRGREFASLAVVGVLLLCGGNGLVTVAERHVPAGLAALLVASMPLWVLVLRAVSGDRPRRATLLGLTIGLAGVGLLVAKGGHGQGASLVQMLIVLGAAFSWALGSVLSFRLPLPADLASATAIEMAISGVVLGAIAPLAGESWSASATRASADALVAIAYLALVGSILAFTAYVWLLQNAPISKVSTYAYVNPAVAVVLGAIILGESIEAVTVVGGLVIVAAVAVVIRSESRPTGPAGRSGEVPPTEPSQLPLVRMESSA